MMPDSDRNRVSQGVSNSRYPIGLKKYGLAAGGGLKHFSVTQ